MALYETLSGGHVAPIVLLEVGELDARFHELENGLAPESLEKNSRVESDKMLKLCNGVGSLVKIHSGDYDMTGLTSRSIIGEPDVTGKFKAAFPKFA